FGFRISGDRPRWSPTRVYSDGLKTYIQFPSSQFADEAPALVELDGGSGTQMVNYRVVGDRYVVDHVIERAALISGV
ncbi:TrbG/VirB9 family P-type conjugative transfer protein, partial [Escherichia coli]|uniref:TrbG/VirB9 family P-type conjugative transfer protein n=1 Tax=Escherichia coli TaxID=562 RepID=UPI0028E0682A